MEPGWRWVARGLALKLAGLVIAVVLFPLALAGLFLWGGSDDVGQLQQNLTPGPWLAAVVSLLGIGILFDWVGRCCCLAAPSSVQGRRLLYGSVACQFLALTCATVGAIACGIPLPNNPLNKTAVLSIFAGSVTFQFVAAGCFTIFLQSLARHVDRPDIERVANKVVGLLAMLYPSLVGLAILAMIVLSVSIALGCCGLFVILGGAIVWIPAAAVVGAVTLVMYVLYGIVLLQLRGEIVNRLDSGTAFHEMEESGPE